MLAPFFHITLMIHFNQLSITPDGKNMIVDVMVRDTKYLKDVYLDEIIIDTQDRFTIGGPSKVPCLRRKFRWEDSLDKPKNCCGLLIKNSHVILEQYEYKYTGSPIEPKVVVFLGGELLFEGEDYVVSYSDNTEPGAATVTITGAGQFSGTRTKKFIIRNADDTLPDVTFNEEIHPTELPCGCDEFDVPEDFDKNDVKIKHARIVIGWQDLISPMYSSLFFVYVKTKGVPAPDAPCGGDSVYTLGVTANLFPVYNSFMCALRELDRDCNIPKQFIDMFLRYEAFTTSVKTGHYIEAIWLWNKWFARMAKKPIGSHNMRADIYPNHANLYVGVPWMHDWYESVRRKLPEGYQAHTVSGPRPRVIPFGSYFRRFPFSAYRYHRRPLPWYGRDEFVQDNYNERYGDREYVDGPTVELFGGPFNEPVGFYSFLPPIGGCNCGR